MIYIDASELRDNSRMRKHVPALYQLYGYESGREFIDAVTVKDLEARTGADIMLTKYKMPVTDTLLKRHVDGGAVLIQLKFGNDFPSSFGSRLRESLHRMYQVTPRSAVSQRVLMFVGGIGCGRDGILQINGKQSQPKRSYAAYHTVVDQWNRFGAYHPEPRESRLAETLKAMDDRIEKPVEEEFWPTMPTADDFADDVWPAEPVKDWRVTIATFPGVGPKRATALKRAMDDHPGAASDLISAMIWVTSPKEEREFMGLPKIPLWGDKTFEACREWAFGNVDTSLTREEWKLVLRFGFFDIEKCKYVGLVDEKESA